MQGYLGPNCNGPQAKGTFAQAHAEDVYRFKCQKSGKVVLTLQPHDCDVDLYVLDSACDPHGTCVGAAVLDGTREDKSPEFVCEAGATYYIALEGYGLERCATASYTLTFELSGACVENCTNGVDDDHNGSIDCQDTSCTADPACREQCTNGIDDDGDGEIDCQDSYCASAPTCLAAITASPPASVTVGVGVPLHATVRVPVGVATPDRIEVTGDGPSIVLHDDGTGGDTVANDGDWSGFWTPSRSGTVTLHFAAIGGAPAAPTDASVAVGEPRKWGSAPAVVFGPPKEGGCLDVETRCATATLDLTGTGPGATAHVEQSPTYDNATVEIRINDNWLPLQGADLPMDGANLRLWDLRLRVGRCCSESRTPQDTLPLTLIATDIATPLVGTVSVNLAPDSIWHCWWPFIATGIGLATVAWYTYGWTSPNGFARTLGLELARCADLEDASFYPIRQHRGTRSGWYRDAHVYLCMSFALRGHRFGRRPSDALVRIRAAGATVRIQPFAGQVIEWQDLDGEWVALGPEESRAPLGRVYRPAGRTDFFFSLRRRAG